jgi:hypothetical protein
MDQGAELCGQVVYTTSGHIMNRLRIRDEVGRATGSAPGGQEHISISQQLARLAERPASEQDEPFAVLPAKRTCVVAS